MPKKVFLLAVVLSGRIILSAFIPQAALAAGSRGKTGGVVKASGETPWEKPPAEARKEGEVVLYGPPLTPARKARSEDFPKSYPGITLDYLAPGGSQVPPKIKSERSACLYIPDVPVGGATGF